MEVNGKLAKTLHNDPPALVFCYGYLVFIASTGPDLQLFYYDGDVWSNFSIARAFPEAQTFSGPVACVTSDNGLQLVVQSNIGVLSGLLIFESAIAFTDQSFGFLAGPIHPGGFKSAIIAANGIWYDVYLIPANTDAPGTIIVQGNVPSLPGGFGVGPPTEVETTPGEPRLGSDCALIKSPSADFFLLRDQKTDLIFLSGSWGVNPSSQRFVVGQMEQIVTSDKVPKTDARPAVALIRDNICVAHKGHSSEDLYFVFSNSLGPLGGRGSNG